MSALEIVAVALGLANILLLVRRSIWNYPFGIATVLLQGWLFLDGKLYSDALLQLFFVALNLYGWVNWARARAQAEDGLPVRWMRGRDGVMALLIVAVATFGWGMLMYLRTDASHPWWDGGVAMSSLLAQGLLARRYIDNWIWWIAVDLMAVPLYWVKGLHLIAGLYIVFLILSAVGFAGWISATKTGREVPA